MVGRKDNINRLPETGGMSPKAGSFQFYPLPHYIAR